MNDGVALLLERMKTNPEEFFDFGSKWAGVIGEHKDFLEAEDRQALTDGLNKLMQQRFTEKVLEELVDPTEESNIKKLGNMFTQNRRKAALAAQIPAIPPITVEQAKHIEAHLKALGQTPIAGVTQTL
jgi:hypothetical protein